MGKNNLTQTSGRISLKEIDKPHTYGELRVTDWPRPEVLIERVSCCGALVFQNSGCQVIGLTKLAPPKRSTLLLTCSALSEKVKLKKKLKSCLLVGRIRRG